MTKTSSAFLWSISERILSNGINFCITLILTRLLLPIDYGVIAIASILFAVSQALIDGGFCNALIQKKETSNVDYSSVFIFNILMSILLYVILFYTSGIIESYFNINKLSIVIQIYAIILILNAIGAVPRTLLIKDLSFKRITLISFLANIVAGCIGISAAFLHFSYWSLVIAGLAQSFISNFLYLICCYWSPQLLFSWKSIKNLGSFGTKIMFNSLISALYSNLYSCIIARKFSAIDLGLYNRAYTLGTTFPINFSDAISRVIFPIFSQRRGETKELKKYFLQILFCLVVFNGSIALYFIFFAQNIVLMLFTEKWLPVVKFLKILSFCGISYSIVQLNWNILKSLGHSSILASSEFIKKSIGIIILILSINYTINLLLIGIFVYSVIDILISFIATSFVSGIKFSHQLYVCIIALIISFVLVIAVYWGSAFISSNVLRIVSTSIFCILCFSAMILVYRSNILKISNYFLPAALWK